VRSVRGVERAGCVAVGCLHIQGSRAATDEAEEACGVVLGRYHILVTVTDPPPARGRWYTRPHRRMPRITSRIFHVHETQMGSARWTVRPRPRSRARVAHAVMPSR